MIIFGDIKDFNNVDSVLFQMKYYRPWFYHLRKSVSTYKRSTQGSTIIFCDVRNQLRYMDENKQTYKRYKSISTVCRLSTFISVESI